MSDEQNLMQEAATEATPEQAQTTTEQPIEQAETTSEQPAEQPKRALTQDDLDKALNSRLAREKEAQEKLQFENFQLKKSMQELQQQYSQFQPQQQYQEAQQQGQAQQQNQGQYVDPNVLQIQAKAYQSEMAMRQKAQDYDAITSDPRLQYGLARDDAFKLAVAQSEDPAGFAYELAKNHGDRLQKIITNPDPSARYRGLVELEVEMKMKKAQAPKVSAAPAPMQPEKSDGTYVSATSPDAMLEQRRKGR